MKSLVSIENLQVFIEGSGPPVKAVDRVSFDIYAGEILGLVGESGCGKTTLALSIGKLLPPRARVVGGEIQFSWGSEVKGKVAYVFQDPMTALNPVLKIKDQLIETVRLYASDTDASAYQISLQLLRQVQISDPEIRMNQYPHQLSGGLRQRVLIAMALAMKPVLLIADEPTTALDATTQDEILTLLKQLKSDTGMSLLLITHDLMAVAPVADRIAVMYAGRLVEVTATAPFYREPSHPYTQALLACIPPIGQGRVRLNSIPGAVPDLRHTPSGCPFHPRCPEVIPTCRTQEPQLKPCKLGHLVSCWRR